jgi:hypothetical protein
VVRGGEFTREAREFARTTKIELIDGSGLAELIGNKRGQNVGNIRSVRGLCGFLKSGIAFWLNRRKASG